MVWVVIVIKLLKVYYFPAQRLAFCIDGSFCRHAFAETFSLLYCSPGLVGDANDTASWAGASVTSLLGLSVATLAEVVGAGVHDDGAL